MSLEIHQFPCLSDNYGFLLHDNLSGLTASIDTPDGAEIARQAKSKGWMLTHIFNTHHHPDHVGGNKYLKDQFGVKIIGPAEEQARITQIDEAMSGGSQFKFGAYDVHVIHTPGHTLGHCVYHIPEAGIAFVGDTLFALGCGRLFEGTPEQMFASMQKLAALPRETLIYCAHEYTLSNGAFAITAEPDNQSLKDYLAQAKELRAKGLPTVPTTIARELAANPFMRAKDASELGARRAAKDAF